MSFLDADFLLHSAAARRLYPEFAEAEPILDYHSHLPPGDLARDRRYENLTEIWLEGDHYKWRAMRANGVPERFCTGNASPREKFQAWAATVPRTLRNPLYHWTHLELRRYFGIEELLNEESAERIWAQAGEQLAGGELSARVILRKFGVRALCTTDDPAASLEAHEELARTFAEVPVYPTFRPDRALQVDQPEAFREWVGRLGAAANIDIGCLKDLLEALRRRHEAFHAAGARLSDHGLERCFSEPCPDAVAEGIFQRALLGQAASEEEHAGFAALLLLFLARLDVEKGWTKQIHLGAMRNLHSRQSAALGPDTGFDAIGDWPQARHLSRFLDRLEQERALPKMIIYNLNPADNYAVAAALGCFQDGEGAARMQFGSGWWFLDQKEGIEWQLNALSNLGLLSDFIGMTTDSRSMMSFPRHEYFRRILCGLIGSDVEKGELPNDDDLLGPLISGICYGNARRTLGLKTGEG